MDDNKVDKVEPKENLPSGEECKDYAKRILRSEHMKWVHTWQIKDGQYITEIWTAWFDQGGGELSFAIIPVHGKELAIWAELHIHPGKDHYTKDVIRIRYVPFKKPYSRHTVMNKQRLPLHSSDFKVTPVDECNIYMNGKEKNKFTDKVGIYNEALVKYAHKHLADKSAKLEKTNYPPKLKQSVHLFPEFDTYHQQPRQNYLYSPTDGTTASVLSVLLGILLCCMLCLIGAAIGCIGGFSIRHFMGKWNKRNEADRKNIAYRNEEI